jgi:chromosome segregation ATPase
MLAMKQTGPLDALRAEIERKRETVARLEQERTDLELEIVAFEAAYNAEVKPLQDELDAVTRHIEEYEARIQLVRLYGNRLNPVQLEAEVDLRLGKSFAHTPDQEAPGAYVRGKWENVAQVA